jgi:hypothetical protein
MCMPTNNFWTSQPIFMKLDMYIMTPEPISTDLHETWYVYHDTWTHLTRVLHKPLPSVIRTLQPPIFYCITDFITHTC